MHSTSSASTNTAPNGAAAATVSMDQQSQRNRVKSRARCCVTGCNRREGDPGYSFHRFPTDKALRNLWIMAINEPCFHPSRSTRICSRHFVRSDFVAKQTEEEEAAAAAARAALALPPGSPTSTPTPTPTPNRRRRLYPTAVPSVFRGRRASVGYVRPDIDAACNRAPVLSTLLTGSQLTPLTVCYNQQLFALPQQQQQYNQQSSSGGIRLFNGSADMSSYDDDNEDEGRSSIDDVKDELRESGNLGNSGLADDDDVLPDVCSIVPSEAATDAASNPAGRRDSRSEPSLISQIVRVALDLDDAQSRLTRELTRLARRQRLQEARLGELVEELTQIVDKNS